jgi:phosphoglycolate phosphatase-like HAD superfamily hydrolase
MYLTHVFDADGTLTDTAPAHIRFCNDLNEEFKFGLPKVNEEDIGSVRRVLANPMKNLLARYGFPEKDLDKLDAIYAERFSTNPRYASKPFPGVSEMLSALWHSRRLVLLTSNTGANVNRDLGSELMQYFEKVIDRDDITHSFGGSKQEAIRRLIAYQAFRPGEMVCVGDMEKDFVAADANRCRFVGVSYGWGFTPDEKRFRVANSVGELQKILLDSEPLA